MRGKVKSRFPDFLLRRITPAHAGKRLVDKAVEHGSWDHPRTCGEKFPKLVLFPCTWGSPPHMRGKASGFGCSVCCFRITPAHAGKSHPVVGCILWCWDHPRTCGEKASSILRFALLRGSPPHMRGKVATIQQSWQTDRITPAHAGKRKISRSTFSILKDHPRTCGEKQQLPSRVPRYWGSPPHMRGKAAATYRNCRCGRITPAHAGKRAIMPEGKTAVRDHPRTCGEKHAFVCSASSTAGSPPHMRGKD